MQIEIETNRNGSMNCGSLEGSLQFIMARLNHAGASLGTFREQGSEGATREGSQRLRGGVGLLPTMATEENVKIQDLQCLPVL